MNRLAFLLALPVTILACSATVPDEIQTTDTAIVGPSKGSNADEGVACGDNTCAPGLVCCNASCGICTAPGGFCTQQVCLSEPEEPKPEDPKPCVKTGCSGTICSDEQVFSTCEWKEEYACYQNAICERQENGECGFRETKKLTSCLADHAPPSEDPPTEPGVSCGDTTCAPGLVCCNASCGICTPPNGACTQQICD